MGFAAQLSIFVFLLGLIVGSFLNAVIWRLSVSARSIFEKHSVCPKCEHALTWRDLAPLASFFMLRGRCRYCGEKISWQYPAVELATAVSFVLIFLFSPPPNLPPQGGGISSLFPSPWWGGIEGGGIGFLLQLAITSFLIVIFVYDLKHYLILDKVVFPAALLALAYQGYMGNWGNALLGAAILSGFFGALYLVSRGRWIGFGDVKLGIFLGFLVPWPTILVLFFLAYLVGAVVSVGLLAWGAKKITDRLPFGTFLTFAAFCAMLWGEEIIRWYFGMIGII